MSEKLELTGGRDAALEALEQSINVVYGGRWQFLGFYFSQMSGF